MLKINFKLLYKKVGNNYQTKKYNFGIVRPKGRPSIRARVLALYHIFNLFSIFNLYQI
jgi:hypothetical protein